MKSPSKYYNTIETEDEDPDPKLQWVTSSGFDPDLNKKLPEQLINRFAKEIK